MNCHLCIQASRLTPRFYWLPGFVPWQQPDLRANIPRNDPEGTGRLNSLPKDEQHVAAKTKRYPG